MTRRVRASVSLMALVRVGPAAALPPGSMLQVDTDCGVYAVCNIDGEIHAVDGICPHRGGPLAHGALHGATIVCPWHAWEFDCRSGEYDFDQAIRLKKHSVTIEDDIIFVDLP